MYRSQRYWAVKRGEESPTIYRTWHKAKRKVTGVRNVDYKKFKTLLEAQQWLGKDEVSGLVSELLQEADTAPNIYESPSAIQQSIKQEYSNTASPPPDLVSSAGDSKDLVLSEEVQESKIMMTNNSSNPPGELFSISSDFPPCSMLTAEQRIVLSSVMEGRNVFFTGSAGTGKSYLLHEIIAMCRKRYSPNQVAVTASTGIAAVHIGGTTLHYWAGIGFGKRSAKSLVGQIENKHQFHRSCSCAAKRWRDCRVLIVDEVSMIDGRLFEKLEHIARTVRKTSRVFGGIQLILCGDFFQLPPVPDSERCIQIPSTFAFDSCSWTRCEFEILRLKKVFRQRDQRFAKMLNAMRRGDLNIDIVTEFQSLSRRLDYADGIEPTDLYPTKAEVEAQNTTRLAALPPPIHVYQSIDTPGKEDDGKHLPRPIVDAVLKRMVAPKHLTLKRGAQVMLIKNIPHSRLVNGSLGRVLDFITTSEACDNKIEFSVDPDHPAFATLCDGHFSSSRTWPLVGFTRGERILCIPNEFEAVSASGNVEAVRRQVPLILAWALSVHKSQGQTLERVRVNLRRVFEKGQAYVALSRATTLETLEVQGFGPDRVMVHPRVLEWDETDLSMQVDRVLDLWEELL